VREAAAETVSDFSEYISEFLDKHALILPNFINVLKELNVTQDETIAKSLFALHEFCKELDDDIKDYLPTLVPLCAGFLSMEGASKDTKYQAL